MNVRPLSDNSVWHKTLHTHSCVHVVAYQRYKGVPRETRLQRAFDVHKWCRVLLIEGYFHLSQFTRSPLCSEIEVLRAPLTECDAITKLDFMDKDSYSKLKSTKIMVRSFSASVNALPCTRLILQCTRDGNTCSGLILQKQVVHLAQDFLTKVLREGVECNWFPCFSSGFVQRHNSWPFDDPKVSIRVLRACMTGFFAH